MGQCLSLDQEELKARAKSDSIDRQLQTWAKEEQPVIKILLLGRNTLPFFPFFGLFFYLKVYGFYNYICYTSVSLRIDVKMSQSRPLEDHLTFKWVCVGVGVCFFSFFLLNSVIQYYFKKGIKLHCQSLRLWKIQTI
jgi:hypothetical protein